jgi:ParB family chromosome partitioning protein
MAEAAQVWSHVVLAGAVHGRTRTVLASVPVDSIRPNPDQPRRHFDSEALEDLAASIRMRGILHPIIVKRDGEGFVIMAGERRYRAARLAGLDVVPALIRDGDPLEIAMIENLQREELSPLEEAEGLGMLIEQYGYTHETLAELIGKSRPYVSNTLALRRLPERIKRAYYETPDVSREILISVARAESPERQEILWRLARLRKLSVKRFRAHNTGQAGAPRETGEIARLVRRLGRKLRAFDAQGLSDDERAMLYRRLRRAQARIGQALELLAAPPQAVVAERTSA